MQTIIGSGGAIGIPLARELKNYTSEIRLVSRNPRKINETDLLHPADLNDPSQIDAAVAGSEVVYCVVGFEYNLKVWQKTWPAFLQELIRSCQRHGTKLVFFDNVYMYDQSAIPHMTESSPINSPSKKGQVRKQLQDIILLEVEAGRLTALIARAADFYGPECNNSLLGKMVIENFQKGKKAQAFGNPEKIHTYTYTPDAAKATALLGNTPEAYGQVWHVPTTKEPLTQLDWTRLIADEMKVAPRVQKIPVWMIKLLGLFIPIMREFPEMGYQYDRDYVLDSSKFEKRFGIYATAPKEGIRKMVESMRVK